MKPLALLLITILMAPMSRAQPSPDNYSFFKLLVTNERNELLLVKWENEWEVMGERYNKGVSVLHYVYTLATSMGIKVKEVKLAALFTQRPVTRINPTLFHYYTASYVSGSIHPPTDCQAIRWFSHEEAMRVIPYEIMKSVIGAIRDNKGKVLGASFETSVDPQTGKTMVNVRENFYPLN